MFLPPEMICSSAMFSRVCPVAIEGVIATKRAKTPRIAGGAGRTDAVRLPEDRGDADREIERLTEGEREGARRVGDCVTQLEADEALDLLTEAEIAALEVREGVTVTVREKDVEVVTDRVKGDTEPVDEEQREGDTLLERDSVGERLVEVVELIEAGGVRVTDSEGV
jgi:hypothetical protein